MWRFIGYYDKRWTRKGDTLTSFIRGTGFPRLNANLSLYFIFESIERGAQIQTDVWHWTVIREDILDRMIEAKHSYSLCYREQHNSYDCSRELGHEYCLKRTEKCRECLCERWVIVHYTGDCMIAAEDWQPFFKDTLRGIDCQYFGYKPLVREGDSDSHEWLFFIRLDKSNTRDIVGAILESVWTLREVQRLGDPSIAEFSDDFGCLFYCLHMCCVKSFLSLIEPYVEGFVVDCFKSNGDSLMKLLEDEKADCSSYLFAQG